MENDTSKAVIIDGVDLTSIFKPLAAADVFTCPSLCSRHGTCISSPRVCTCGSCKKISAGRQHSCGVRELDGHAVCWGSSNDRHGNDVGATTPPVPGAATAIVAASASFSAALHLGDLTVL